MLKQKNGKRLHGKYNFIQQSVGFFFIHPKIQNDKISIMCYFFILEESFNLRETTPSTGIPRVKISEYPTLKAETANNFLHEPYNTLSEFKASAERRPS